MERGKLEIRERCWRCRGTGIYQWGAVVNGKCTHSGACYQCQGKGWQSDDDKRRNAAYMRYAIVRSFQ